MGGVTLWMQMSLDGFADGPDQEPNWPVVDEELCAALLDELGSADLFLYGRKTYEIMTRFWPQADTDPAISQFYIDFSRCWKSKPKIVFSRTLTAADWNTRIVRGNLIDEVTRMKAHHRMVLFGGTDIARTFIQYGLIDEYRLFVHPILLGGGTPLFPTHVDTAGLRLIDTTTFDSAVIQFHYRRSHDTTHMVPLTEPIRSVTDFTRRPVHDTAEPPTARHPIYAGRTRWRH